jgi:hypothetical protein
MVMDIQMALQLGLFTKLGPMLFITGIKGCIAWYLHTQWGKQVMKLKQNHVL